MSEASFGSEGPCSGCGVQTSSLAANPGLWPVFFPDEEKSGKVKPHCTKCVMERWRSTPLLEAEIARLRAALDIINKDSQGNSFIELGDGIVSVSEFARQALESKP